MNTCPWDIFVVNRLSCIIHSLSSRPMFSVRLEMVLKFKPVMVQEGAGRLMSAHYTGCQCQLTCVGFGFSSFSSVLFYVVLDHFPSVLVIRNFKDLEYWVRPNVSGAEESALLLCALCKENFASAWDLMVHAQAAHMVNIYQLGSKDASQVSGWGGRMWCLEKWQKCLMEIILILERLDETGPG